MSQEQWTAVDQYVADLLIPADPALEAALQASTAAGLPSISVSPAQGRLLFLLAQFQGARNVLELGTLGGYSTICLARALPAGGRVTTLEADPKHAAGRPPEFRCRRLGWGDRPPPRIGPRNAAATCHRRTRPV